MEEQTDKPLYRNFSLMVVLLALFAFLVVLFAKLIITTQDTVTPENLALAEQRTRPVAEVYTSEAALPVVAEISPEPVPDNTADTSYGSYGKEFYTSACSFCHTSGAAGAPQPGSEDLKLRAEKGLDALLQTALNGINAMPPRGGRPDLSDEEIRAAIEFMLE